MSEVPDYASDVTSADKYVRTLPPVRVSISQMQFIIELRGSWGTDTSKAVRGMIEFCAKHMPKIAEEEGSPISGKTRTAANLLLKKKAAREWNEIRDDLYQSYYMAIRTDNERIRDELLEALAESAEEQDIKWPPPSVDPDPIMHNKDLRYVHDKVMSLIAKSEDHRVSLRNMETSTGKRRDYLVPKLKELESAGYVLTSEEQRSGQTTVWIEVPMMEVSQ